MRGHDTICSGFTRFIGFSDKFSHMKTIVESFGAGLGVVGKELVVVFIEIGGLVRVKDAFAGFGTCEEAMVWGLSLIPRAFSGQ